MSDSPPKTPPVTVAARASPDSSIDPMKPIKKKSITELSPKTPLPVVTMSDLNDDDDAWTPNPEVNKELTRFRKARTRLRKLEQVDKSKLTISLRKLKEKEELFHATAKSFQTHPQAIEFRQLSTKEVFDAISVLMEEIVDAKTQGRDAVFQIPQNNNWFYNPEWKRYELLEKMVDYKLPTEQGNTEKLEKFSHVAYCIIRACKKETYISKRDIYYESKHLKDLFDNQKSCDLFIEVIAGILKCTRDSLRILASVTGFVHGNLVMVVDGVEIDLNLISRTGYLIPTLFDDHVTIKSSNADFILVVESDSIFQRLCHDKFCEKYPSILITGKGTPDYATRRLVRLLNKTLKIPTFILVDCNPHGVQIANTYTSGGKYSSRNNASLTTPNIYWIGLKPSQVAALELSDSLGEIEMSDKDKNKIENLLKLEVIQDKDDWKAELQLMLENKKLVEAEILWTTDITYLTDSYLPNVLASLAGDEDDNVVSP